MKNEKQERENRWTRAADDAWKAAARSVSAWCEFIKIDLTGEVDRVTCKTCSAVVAIEQSPEVARRDKQVREFAKEHFVTHHFENARRRYEEREAKKKHKELTAKVTREAYGSPQ